MIYIHIRTYIYVYTKIYFGLAETSFKAWIANHNKDFNHEQYKKNIEFSKYIWSLKEDQLTSRISWSTVGKVYGRTKINLFKSTMLSNF